MAGNKNIYVINCSGTITPVLSKYICSGIASAVKNNAECVVIVLNSTAGEKACVEDIIQNIAHLSIPVITYIYPHGTKMFSSGLVIASLSHFTVFSPDSYIKSFYQFFLFNKFAPKDTISESMALVSSTAKRGKNILETVSKSLFEGKTYKDIGHTGFAGFYASDINDVIQKLNGMELLVDQKKTVLTTGSGQIINVKMGNKDKLINILENPNLIYVLFLIGLCGLIYELMYPKLIVPAILGGIFSVYSLIFFKSLSISLIGLVIAAVAIIMLFLSSRKYNLSLIIAGVIFLMIGPVVLFSPQYPYFYPSVLVIIATTFLLSYFIPRIKIRNEISPLETVCENNNNDKIFTEKADS